MYKVTYLSKDGEGFSETEPWVLDDFEDINLANKEAKRLIKNGFKDVNVVKSDDQNIYKCLDCGFVFSVEEGCMKCSDCDSTNITDDLSDDDYEEFLALQ